MSTPETTRPSWNRLGSGAAGIRRYGQVVRDYWWLVAIALVITTSAAILYVATTDKVYEADAGVLVSPIPGEAQTLISLGLINDSSDPLRGTETAAVLIDTITVAEQAESDLQGKIDPVPSAEELLQSLTVEPIAESSLVSVKAQASTPERAAAIANAFGTAVTKIRSQQLRQKIDAQLPTLQEQVDSAPPGSDTKSALAGQLAQLQLLRASGDPTLKLETKATPPDSPVEPRPKLSIAAGILAGLILGLGAAFAAYALDPRLRREEQLRATYSLPILARVPKWNRSLRDQLQRGWRNSHPFHAMTAQAVEAYRSLGTILSASNIGHAHSVLVTSPSAGDGKTSTAVNLASALALGGNTVILIEADLRHPDISNILHLKPKAGLGSVLLERTSLEDALVTVPAHESRLQVLAADKGAPRRWAVDALAGEGGVALLAEAKQFADYVIVDSPPLTEVIDALSFAQTADSVLLVVRADRTKLSRIEQLTEMLAQNHVSPAGFVLVGAPRLESAYYTSARSIYAQPSRTPAVMGQEDPEAEPWTTPADPPDPARTVSPRPSSS